MSIIFEVLSWAAMIALIGVSFPQIILNYRRKSTEGVSWSMFLLLLFGMSILSVRSFFVTDDPVVRLNYTFGALISLIANIQIFYYRKISGAKPRPLSRKN